jgi:hypothetical protein
MGSVFRNAAGENHYYTDEGRRFAVESRQDKPAVGAATSAAGFECAVVTELYDDPEVQVSFLTTLGYASRRPGVGGAL